ncbi:arginine/serine-rich coiled-coil protein 2 isoform X2 [Ceratitis capitata]|nr:arginine/serine-rich coiled-coil protein 2 isoform X2 [Ceratitis capitata]
MMGDGGSGGSRRDPPSSRSNIYKDEESQRQKSSSFGNNNRTGSESYYSREGNNKRDNRDRDSRRENRDNVREYKEEKERDSRDGRYTKDYSRYEYKNDRSRPREYQNEYKRERDNYDNRPRPPREDERYRPSSSSYKNSRYSGNGRDERPRYDSFTSNAASSSYRQHHQNRHIEHYDRSGGGRHRRRSNSLSPSPTSTSQRNYSKRSTHDDKSGHRTRSRSRSVTPVRPDSRERERGGVPLEKARLSALEMERKIQSTSRSSQDKELQPSQTGARSTEALLSLPLNETAPKQPNVIAVAPVATCSKSSGSEPAVIHLPSYYNPNVINPNKYAEQVQKRKLLWGAKKVEDTAAKWGNAQFSQDSDGKVASKFMRLMGIKGAAQPKSDGEEVEQKATPSVAPDVKTREVMFSNMEQQYEVARQATHTMRGVGLGFSSQARPF